MRLYFLRHGPALERAEWSGADSARQLSTDGEQVVRSVAAWIAEHRLEPDALITSPYERALHTAVLVREVLEGDIPLIEEPDLEPGRFTVDSLADMLQPHADSRSIMLVGHEPSMTEVLAEIIGGGEFVFKKGGLARVDLHQVDPPSGVLRWFMPPKLMG